MVQKNVPQLPVFEGIPREGLAFLAQLERNNNRDWFLQHKHEFEQSLLIPMRSLVIAVREILAPIAPSFRIDPLKSIHRIHRDVRFGQDKSPYKNHLAANFIDTGSNHTDGLYLMISAKGAAAGGGFYMPSSAELRSIRGHISDQGKVFRGIVEDVQIRRRFGAMRGERLKRAPLGFSSDDEMLDYLQHKQFYFIRDYQPEDALRADFGKRIAADYICLLPFVRWISEAANEKRKTAG